MRGDRACTAASSMPDWPPRASARARPRIGLRRDAPGAAADSRCCGSRRGHRSCGTHHQVIHLHVMRLPMSTIVNLLPSRPATCICACAEASRGCGTAGRSRAIRSSPDRRRPAARSRCTCRWRRPRARPAPGDADRWNSPCVSTGQLPCVEGAPGCRSQSMIGQQRGDRRVVHQVGLLRPAVVTVPVGRAGRQAEGLHQQEAQPPRRVAPVGHGSDRLAGAQCGDIRAA